MVATIFSDEDVDGLSAKYSTDELFATFVEKQKDSGSARSKSNTKQARSFIRMLCIRNEVPVYTEGTAHLYPQYHEALQTVNSKELPENQDPQTKAATFSSAQQLEQFDKYRVLWKEGRSRPDLRSAVVKFLSEDLSVKPIYSVVLD